MGKETVFILVGERIRAVPFVGQTIDGGKLLAGQHQMTRIFKGLDVRWLGSSSWRTRSHASNRAGVDKESTWTNDKLSSGSWTMESALSFGGRGGMSISWSIGIL